MKFGHHGANHPVQDLRTGAVMISSQNHGFAVDEDSLPDTLEATHRSLFDGSLQGIHHRERPAFSFQGHPEASPGPHDVAPVFDHFIALMQERGSMIEAADEHARYWTARRAVPEFRVATPASSSSGVWLRRRATDLVHLR